MHHGRQHVHLPYGLSQSCGGACYRITTVTLAAYAYFEIVRGHGPNLLLLGTCLLHPAILACS
jgi:hypothetical protein